MKPLDEYLSKKKPDGRVNYYRTCKECMYPLIYQKEKSNPEMQSKRKEQRRTWKKESRKDPKHWARNIYHDTRKSDRKHNRDNDLSYDFIRAMINCPCPDCGRSNIRMTLDRIDNTKGHTQDNVRACCIRCNYTRGDMPYEAWKLFAEVMKKATKLGLLDNWKSS